MSSSLASLSLRFFAYPRGDRGMRFSLIREGQRPEMRSKIARGERCGGNGSEGFASWELVDFEFE